MSHCQLQSEGGAPLRRAFGWLLVLAALTSSGEEPGPLDRDPGQSFAPPDRALFRQGRFVYQKHCIVCHGRFGEGDGELVKDWDVRPRDFTKGRFKYRSTPYGKLPTNADLKRTIRHGVSGTAMPIFDKLQGSELRAVIEYIKFFSPAWRDPNNYGQPMEIPAPPDWFEDDQQRQTQAAYGRVLFRQTCAPCHGPDGAGNGVAAAGLKDAEGQPIQPADLRPPWKCGGTPGDVYRTIMTGISGTPMMGFNGAIEPLEAWRIVAFVASLKQDEVDQDQGE